MPRLLQNLAHRFFGQLTEMTEPTYLDIEFGVDDPSLLLKCKCRAHRVFKKLAQATPRPLAPSYQDIDFGPEDKLPQPTLSYQNLEFPR
jgi:hypothetical protein